MQSEWIYKAGLRTQTTGGGGGYAFKYPIRVPPYLIKVGFSILMGREKKLGEHILRLAGVNYPCFRLNGVTIRPSLYGSKAARAESFGEHLPLQ